MLLLVRFAPAQTGRRRSVLIVLPDPPGRPFSTAILDGIQSELRAADSNIAVSADYIRQASQGRPEFQAAQLAWYRTKYAGSRFDALIVVGPAALESVLAIRSALWPDVPIVFTAVDSAIYTRHGAEPNMTGVLVGSFFPMNVALARDLLPDTQRIAVIGGASPVDRYFNSRFTAVVKQANTKFESIDLTGLGVEELKKRVAVLPPHTAIVIFSYLYDPEGRPVFQRDLVAALAPKANAPIFSGADFAMGVGMVGGFLYSSERMGTEAARLAVRVMNGDAAASIAVAPTQSGRYEFDARELQKWKIPKNRLPARATVLYQPFSIWQRYHWWILGIALAVVSQYVLIAVLLYERRRARETEAARKRAELEARVTREEISHLNRLASMGELAASLAHELNQPLAGILTNAQAASRFLAQQPADLAEVRAALEDIRDDDIRAGEVIRRMRQMLKKGQSQATLLDPNLVAREAVALLRTDANLRMVSVVLETSPDCPKVYGDVVQLQQVIINLVVNAMEAMSQRIVVRTSVGADGRSAEISVGDNGPGISEGLADRVFQPFFTTKQEGLGMGLSISRSIVEAHGGRIGVESLPGTGATFHVTLPMAAVPMAAVATAASPSVASQ